MIRFILGVVFVVATIATAAAQSRDLLPNTIGCAAFTKAPDGSWVVKGSTTFDAGSTKRMTLSDTSFSKHVFGLDNGIDLADLLDAKCGKK